MDERRYRESRLCRLLGNPVIYQLIDLLHVNGPMTPSRVASVTGRDISTISAHLAKLRNADIVRYETVGKETRYWLKHGSEIKELMNVLGRVVDALVKIE
jgi:DNA-binding transcriptional ArsR family regulator